MTTPIPTNFIDNTGQQADDDYFNNLGERVNDNTDDISALDPLSALLGIASATVATSEALTSTSYVDLATATDSVAVTVGPSGKALVIVSAKTVYGSGSGNFPYVGFAVSGATTQAASDARSGRTAVVGTEPVTAASIRLVTGLTPGSNTFKMKYRLTTAGSYNISDRHIIVIPLP